MFSKKFNQGLMIVGMSVCTTNYAFAEIENTVTATGTGPDGVVTASDTESVSVVLANPNLSIEKLSSVSGSDEIAEAGETITYTFKVKNIGNVTLQDVKVIEGVTNAKGEDVVPDNPLLFADMLTQGDSTDANLTDDKWDILAPGDTLHFTGDYLVTYDDVELLQN